MKSLFFNMKINAPKQKVWDIMFEPELYRAWRVAFSPNSHYEGKLEQGERIKIFDPDVGGAFASIEELEKYSSIFLRYVSIISKDNQEDTQSDVAKAWMITTEKYTFSQSEGITILTIEIKTHDDFAEMFSKSWQLALKKLKDLVESN